jgi:CBS domain-containing protein
VRPDEEVAEAARLMCDHSVGALIVTDASGETPIGVLTDRDIVRMIAAGLDPKVARVGQFAAAPLRTVCVADSLLEAVRKMREHGVRRLPIVDGEGRLIGIVSLDDVLTLLAKELAYAAGAIGSEIEHERRLGAGAGRATR